MPAGEVALEELIVPGLVLVVVVILYLSWRGRWWQRQRNNWRPDRVITNPVRFHDPTDPSDQLRSVMAADFTAKKVMRAGEYRVFRIVETVLKSNPAGRRVFAQTALGEVIESKDRNAHSAINSKRVDVIVIDWNGLPLVAIEYQGEGHYQGSAAARDAVKKEALRKAGVQYVEIMSHHTDGDVERLTRDALDRATRANTPTSPTPGAPAPEVRIDPDGR